MGQQQPIGFVVEKEAVDEAIRDAEVSLVSLALIEAPSLVGVTISGKQFYSTLLGKAFDTLKESQRLGTDRIEDLLELGWKSKEVSALMDRALSPTLSKYYAAKINEAFLRRRYKESLVAEIERAKEEGADLSVAQSIEALKEKLSDIDVPQKVESTHIVDVFKSFIQEIQAGTDVVPTGYIDIDSQCRGLPKYTTTIIAGRPAMGKSATALNIMLRQASAGIPCLYVGLEDRKEQHVRRLTSIMAKIDTNILTYEGLAKSSTTVHQDLLVAAQKMAKLPIYFLDGRLTTAEIIEAARYHVDTYGVQVVYVDHAQQIVPDDEDKRPSQRNYEIESSAQKLTKFAEKTGVAMVLVAQINREGVGRPAMHQLRDSGSLEMIARLILLLYRDEYYNEDSADKGVLEVIIGKANHGPSGSTVRLKWIGERCEVAELARY